MEMTTRTNPPFPAGNGTGNTTLDKAATSMHGTVDKITRVADEAARNVKPAIDRVAHLAHQTVDKVADVAGPTAAWMREQGDSLKAVQRKATADTAQAISAHPWKALGIALAAGFVISRFIR